jgi:hydroxymethylglutaryl-CoA reductase (NADPH)
MSPSPPRDPKNDHSAEILEARRRFTGKDLPHVAGLPCPPEEAQGSVEGMIGYAQVPLGIAAPLVLRGDFEGTYAVPFATTEGTMIASYQRGLRVTADAGGILVHVLRDGLGNWPTLSFPSVSDALAAARWVEENRALLVAAAEATTRTGRVTSLEWELLGRRLVLYVEMNTGDAHGINMLTRATDAVIAKIPNKGQSLVHGKDVEKRATTHRWRGKWVVAEVVIPAALVAERLRTTAAEMAELWATYQLGFARLGTHNHAIQVANGLSAMFIATGQDAAYVAESVTATLSLEDRAGDLYATLDMPNLHAATVGGGTQKGTARECQALIGAKSARELACVFAGALLAGDVNLAASFLGGGFVASHERLGRNRPPAGQ